MGYSQQMFSGGHIYIRSDMQVALRTLSFNRVYLTSDKPSTSMHAGIENNENEDGRVVTLPVFEVGNPENF